MAVDHAALRKRFGLSDGQFFGFHKFKNLWWYLNGEKFGYGDLREEDIDDIQNELTEDETFAGYHEHHMSRDMQRETPMIVITHAGVIYPKFEPVTDETRQKIKEEYG